MYRTVQELQMQAFNKQSSERLTELFRIKCGIFNNYLWMFRILFWNVCTNIDHINIIIISWTDKQQKIKHQWIINHGQWSNFSKHTNYSVILYNLFFTAWEWAAEWKYRKVVYIKSLQIHPECKRDLSRARKWKRDEIWRIYFLQSVAGGGG